MRKNIVLISCSENYSGAERILFEINNILLKENHIYLILNKKQAQYYSSPNNNIIFFFSRYFKISQNILGVFYYFFNSILLFFKLRKIKRPLLYCNDFESLIFVSFTKFMIPSSKVIWHVHDIYNFNKFKTKLIFKFVDLIVDKYICLTSHNSRRLEKVVRNKVYILNNFSRYECSIPKNIAKIKYLTLGYVGQITKWKGIDKIIDVVNSINLNYSIEIKLKIIGKPHYKDDFEYFNFLKKSTNNNVNICWSSYSDNLIEFYRSIDFLVNFSDNEPFGLVIVEAMSQGVPVISFDGDGPSEIISKNYKNGIILKSKDTNEIVNELIPFFLNLESTTYERMSFFSIKTINKYFSKYSFHTNLNLILKD